MLKGRLMGMAVVADAALIAYFCGGADNATLDCTGGNPAPDSMAVPLCRGCGGCNTREGKKPARSLCSRYQPPAPGSGRA
jgi:hypothetical protein